MTVIALLALCVMLMSINPDLRQHAEQMAAHPDLDSLRGTVTHAIVSGMGVFQGYAGDNAYLFTFLVAACVLVVLMLKVIS